MGEFKIELGSTVKSDISGFKGIAISRSEHLNGCNRYWIQPPVDKDGKYVEGYWIDEPELILVKPPKVERHDENGGGFVSKVR